MKIHQFIGIMIYDTTLVQKIVNKLFFSMPLGIHKGEVHMKGKIENFLRRLYNDLNGDYKAEKEELEKIQCSIKAFE